MSTRVIATAVAVALTVTVFILALNQAVSPG
jgi:hypothetical protein